MSPITYVRWKLGEPREIRLFPPLKEDHSLVKDQEFCIVCGNDFAVGDRPQMLALGAETEENRIKCAQGRWFTAMAIILHTECMIGKVDDGTVHTV